jgi:hypothetical protein
MATLIHHDFANETFTSEQFPIAPILGQKHTIGKYVFEYRQDGWHFFAFEYLKQDKSTSFTTMFFWILLIAFSAYALKKMKRWRK